MVCDLVVSNMGKDHAILFILTGATCFGSIGMPDGTKQPHLLAGGRAAWCLPLHLARTGCPSSSRQQLGCARGKQFDLFTAETRQALSS